MPSTTEQVRDISADIWNDVHYMISAWSQIVRLRFHHKPSSCHIRHRVSWLGLIHRYNYLEWDGEGTMTLYHGFNPIAMSRFEIQPRLDGKIVIES